MKKVVLIILSVSSAAFVSAKNLGKQGASWSVAEEGVIAMIKRKLAILDIEKHQKILAEKARRSFEYPKGTRLPQAVRKREYVIDPSHVVAEDIKLSSGQILHKAGTKINPLDYEPLTKKLIFIDGDKQNNILFALSYPNNEIILVNGSPAEVSKQLNRNVYFDQMKEFTKKFKIAALPAILEQQDEVIKITEVVVND